MCESRVRDICVCVCVNRVSGICVCVCVRGVRGGWGTYTKCAVLYTYDAPAEKVRVDIAVGCKL